jgi:thioredoxin
MKIFKNILISVAILIPAGSLLSQTENKKAATDTVIVLDKAGFLEKIYNYEKNPGEWIYEGNLPCIIDFYADWCPPCKKVAPVLKDLAAEYKGQVIFYKINVDKERELAAAFKISNIPTFFFIPAGENPQSAAGALPRETFVKVIEEFLLNNRRADLAPGANE